MKKVHAAGPALLALGLCTALWFAPLADGTTEQGSPQAVDARTMKAEEARQLLAAVIGVWDMKGESIGADGKPEFTLQGRCVWQWSMNGAFAIGDTLLSNGSAVLQEIDCLGFNDAGGTFQRTVMTDHDSAMIWQQGSWDEGARTFTMQSVGAIPTAQGGKRKVSTIVDLSRPDAMTWTTSYSEDGRLVGTFRLACARAQAGEQESQVIPGLPTQPPMSAGGGIDAAGLQDQLNQMVATKKRLQGQIEDWKKRVKDTQSSFDQLTSP
jgi:hypothetical protein